MNYWCGGGSAAFLRRNGVRDVSAFNVANDGGWVPPDPKLVPCGVLLAGYRPLASIYCCGPKRKTDLELRFDSVAYYNSFGLPEKARRACIGMRLF